MEATLKIIENALARQVAGWSGLYNHEAINYIGKTAADNKDNGDEFDTEVAARWILNRFELFSNGIKKIERNWRTGCIKGRPYAQISHTNLRQSGIATASKNRPEEHIGQLLFLAGESSNWEIGTIIDYQVPLKNKSSDFAGKIDVLSKDAQRLRILELKKEDSKETMLRCILESFTYFKTIGNIDKFRNSFDAQGLEIEICPLYFENSQPDTDLKQPHKYLSALVTEIQKEVHVGFARISKNKSENVREWCIKSIAI